VSETIHILLDDRERTATLGETVLDVARREGVAIPTLCHHPALEPYGACRVCMVEVRRGTRTRIVTACEYPVADGDSVVTDSPRVRRVRRVSLELLLARSPDAEVVQRLAAEHGVEQPRFGRPADTAMARRCILCGLCVRVCDEVVGRSAIGHARRGTAREVTSPFGAPADRCIGCGACAAICPTGAITVLDLPDHRELPELNTRLPRVRCAQCGDPFATRQQIELLLIRPDLPEWVADTCPRCRRERFAAELGQGRQGVN